MFDDGPTFPAVEAGKDMPPVFLFGEGCGLSSAASCAVKAARFVARVAGEGGGCSIEAGGGTSDAAGGDAGGGAGGGAMS